MGRPLAPPSERSRREGCSDNPLIQALTGDTSDRTTLDDMRLPSSRTAVYAALVTMFVIGGGDVACRATDRQHVAIMLNIGRLPVSVSDIDCASFGFTDVLERCAFGIAPADVHTLLSGYRYVEAVACRSDGSAGSPCLNANERSQSSHTFCCGPHVGVNFSISHTFVATPEDAEHGGSITILLDRTRSLAMVDLYVE